MLCLVHSVLGKPSRQRRWSRRALAFLGFLPPVLHGVWVKHLGILDPYAKAIGREIKWDDSLFGYTIEVPEGKAVFLCRCGQSQTKPFCDASHKAAGFVSAVRAADVTAG